MVRIGACIFGETLVKLEIRITPFEALPNTSIALEEVGLAIVILGDV
jgi:hypothetical protein